MIFKIKRVSEIDPPCPKAYKSIAYKISDWWLIDITSLDELLEIGLGYELRLDFDEILIMDRSISID